MCLWLNEEFDTVGEARNAAFIAEHDILVYKYLHFDLKSPFMFSQYELGKLYKTEFSYSTSAFKYYCYVEGGFHSYLTLDIASRARFQFRDARIFFGVIPKGARFYINRYNEEIVSDEIIIFNSITDSLKVYPEAKDL